MIVLKRTRAGTEAFPREDIDLVGSTGNIYTVSDSLLDTFCVLLHLKSCSLQFGPRNILPPYQYSALACDMPHAAD